MVTKRTRTKFTKEQKDLAMQMLANGYKVDDISRDVGISKASLYKWKYAARKPLSIEDMDNVIRDGAVKRDKASKSPSKKAKGMTIEDIEDEVADLLDQIIFEISRKIGSIKMWLAVISAALVTILYKIW